MSQQREPARAEVDRVERQQVARDVLRRALEVVDVRVELGRLRRARRRRARSASMRTERAPAATSAQWRRTSSLRPMRREGTSDAATTMAAMPDAAAAERLESLLGGPEPAPAGGRRASRRPAARARGRRLGQDPRPHPPDRVAHPRGRRTARRDPRDHVHQQGRAGDARARRAAARPLDPVDVGDDVPRRLRADPARRGAAARLHAPVHDLRPVGLAPPRQALPRRASAPTRSASRRPPSSTRSRTRRTSCAWPRTTASSSARSSSRPSPTPTTSTSARSTA